MIKAGGTPPLKKIFLMHFWMNWGYIKKMRNGFDPLPIMEISILFFEPFPKEVFVIEYLYLYVSVYEVLNEEKPVFLNNLNSMYRCWIPYFILFHFFYQRRCFRVLPFNTIVHVVLNCAADSPFVSQSVFTITEMAPTRALSWLKAPNSVFTLWHYVKLGHRRNYHKGQVAIRHYTNQPALCSLWRPDFRIVS